jgi:hypothetical protein
LTVQPGFGLLSQGKSVAMPGSEINGWGTKQVVDGDKNTGWSSQPAQKGEAPWIMIDLEDVVELSRVHLYPRIVNDAIGYNFPVDFEFSVSMDGQSFSKVLAVTDYKVTSLRNNKTKYVWDLTLNDYKEASPKETEDLAITAVGGKKSPADYPQYFVLPEGTQGRYLKITGNKLKDEKRMQFTELEVFGTKK